ncbi:hypothetical protein CPB85DRAFT_1263058 [Mucidula mucida]|nr:hypothetical protein CPB85DRAFT_1263058 [Mucidula mucida]
MAVSRIDLTLSRPRLLASTAASTPRVSLAYPRRHAHPPVGPASLRHGKSLYRCSASTITALVEYTGLSVVAQVLFLVWPPCKPQTRTRVNDCYVAVMVLKVNADLIEEVLTVSLWIGPCLCSTKKGVASKGASQRRRPLLPSYDNLVILILVWYFLLADSNKLVVACLRGTLVRETDIEDNDGALGSDLDCLKTSALTRFQHPYWTVLDVYPPPSSEPRHPGITCCLVRRQSFVLCVRGTGLLSIMNAALTDIAPHSITVRISDRFNKLLSTTRLSAIRAQFIPRVLSLCRYTRT